VKRVGYQVWKALRYEEAREITSVLVNVGNVADLRTYPGGVTMLLILISRMHCAVYILDAFVILQACITCEQLLDSLL
jgi:hypothetical protein